MSIGTSGQDIVLIELTCCVEAYGWVPGPVEVSTLVGEDSIGLGRVVSYDQGLVAVYLQ